MPKDRSWLLLWGSRRTLEQFRTAWKRLEPHVWKTWLITLTIGWIASGLLAFLLALAGQTLAEGGYLDNDPAWLRRITETSPITFDAAMYLGVIGDSLYLFVLVPAAALLATWLGRPLRALSILASLLMTDLVVFVAWQTWNRARPDIIQNGTAAPPLHSFPSGHTVQAIVVYGLFAYFWMRATRRWGERLLALFLYLLIIATVILTRLELGTHWPSDIVAAIPIGGVWLASLIFALWRAETLASQPSPQEKEHASNRYPRTDQDVRSTAVSPEMRR